MLDKTYSPQAIEDAIYGVWEEAGAFAAGASRPEGARPDGKPYAIVIPPPNVTGSLHMGHALNNTLQDILVRFERMRGRDVLWQPGTDHAGIATQMVVERQLMERQEPNRRAMGREAFIKRVWQWKEESGNTIVGQLKRLGCSCDWSRLRFTMDEGLSRAVRKVFVELYRAGLIYKDKRLVNWDPELLTAISDLEVEQIEMKGHLWHLRYPIEGGNGAYIVVATTRPETMLGDTAVAVHPDDERYKHLVGKNVILPLVGRRIPIIADEYSDPEKGSGAVKITPAHDFNDFEVGKRHGLPMITIMGPEGKLLLDPNPDFTRGIEPSPQLKAMILEFNGVFRFAARKMIAARLEADGLMEKIEPHSHAVPHGDRSNAVIEPRLTDQWYVDAKTLAKPAIDAVKRGRTVFVPKNWETTYFHWMENIQPWCISRQLWWGHQIPAWYGPRRQDLCRRGRGGRGWALWGQGSHYGKEVALDARRGRARHLVLIRAVAVLDARLARSHARARPLLPDRRSRHRLRHHLLLGRAHDDDGPPCDGGGAVPRRLYPRAGPRREGPEDVEVEGERHRPPRSDRKLRRRCAALHPCRHGGAGTRHQAQPGRVEGYRNFATKLWNAARFTEINGCRPRADFAPASAKLTVNRWIEGESERTAAAVTEALEAFRFNEAAAAIYHFIWHVYCDWYLELIKPILAGSDEAAAAETRAVAAFVLDRALVLLHPFMPFVTEELWAKLGEEAGGRASLLMLTPWPEQEGLQNADADAEIGWLIRFISEVRSVRAEMNVPAGAKVPLVIAGAGDETKARVARHRETLQRLARLDSIEYGRPQAGAVQIVLDEATLALPLAGIIDIDAEQKRLRREIDKVGSEIKQLDAKLANEKFVAARPGACGRGAARAENRGRGNRRQARAGAEAPRSRTVAPQPRNLCG